MTGPLAEGPSNRPGRMSEPETILAHAERLLATRGQLAGRRVVVTAGPTREALDPVRLISNRSSGKMGYRLAEAAWARGAEVILIPACTDAMTGYSRVRTAALARALENQCATVLSALTGDATSEGGQAQNSSQHIALPGLLGDTGLHWLSS